MKKEKALSGKTPDANPKNAFARFMLSAIGIVFGDIGTSPLYTLKTVFSFSGNDQPDPALILGSLSLIIWTLIIVTTIKYVGFAMRMDNDGEGGILALMALLDKGKKNRSVIAFLGLAGACLIYGDGAITPAISVLSAVEGLNIATPEFKNYILPISVGILLALFAVQPRGTSAIGGIFGPIMLVWFVVLALLGIGGLIHHPSILKAINPSYGLTYLYHHKITGLYVLGAVFLCATGAEALYADMGHFGRVPISAAWVILVFPSLILNYAGQAALVIDGQSVSDNVFYLLCPKSLLMPLIILATIATIIASQAIITGAFSMTRQAINLGWLPMMRIVQTSKDAYGQIYVGVVNWLLMAATISITLLFKKSDNLASAYGIAVSTTMLATSLLLYSAFREKWKWSRLKAGALASIFIIVDCSFVIANSRKIADGGYVPLLIATFIYGCMWLWHTGVEALTKQFNIKVPTTKEFFAMLKHDQISRVPGAAVFLTRLLHDIPPPLTRHIERNHALQERVLILTVTILPVPRTSHNQRIEIHTLAPGFWRGHAYYGFMEHPDIANLLHDACENGCDMNLSNVTYYTGHMTAIPRPDKKGLPQWIVVCFAFMLRNAVHVGDYFRFPTNELVEIGWLVSI